MTVERVGDAVLKAKDNGKRNAKNPDGRFQVWVWASTDVGYEIAAEYMRVVEASASKSLDLQSFDGRVRPFLDALATQKAKADARSIPCPTVISGFGWKRTPMSAIAPIRIAFRQVAILSEAVNADLCAFEGAVHL